ncbi:hypothetical protein NS115_03755 [Paenibacillus jamilae]|uniref:Uncharacterized protein n=1 Tax=Paenibacillus jamilae TaxID=114136 RepID=A0ACC4ZZ97_9BACL|nr:hypothetical protein [Paenibacillus jamilae]KTS84454.1 hypothetical protein NS115_03755 [Paenibacillus jamilae]
MLNHNTKIALCGGARSGKDTVAEYLVLNHNFTRFAFGDELKRLYHEIFGHRVNGKDREGYQWFGQAMRDREPNIWVRKCFEAIELEEQRFNRKACQVEVEGKILFHLPANPLRTVISDLRQPNEYAALREQGYVIVRVDSSPEDRIRRAEASGDVFRPEDMQHDTESHYASFIVDYEICNDGSVEQLYEQTERVYAAITGGAARGIR